MARSAPKPRAQRGGTKQSLHRIKIASLPLVARNDTKFNAFVLAPLVIVLCFSGCAKIAHLDELLRLKNYSEEKERQAAYVAERDKQFDVLCQVVQDGTVTRYGNKNAIVKEFGDPIMITPATADDPLEIWLYRYQAKFTGSPKVYLFFDGTGQLMSWRYAPGSDQKQTETSEVIL